MFLSVRFPLLIKCIGLRSFQRAREMKPLTSAHLRVYCSLLKKTDSLLSVPADQSALRDEDDTVQLNGTCFFANQHCSPNVCLRLETISFCCRVESYRNRNNLKSSSWIAQGGVCKKNASGSGWAKIRRRERLPDVVANVEVKCIANLSFSRRK